MQIVYKITNKMNNKVYIGSTFENSERFYTHFNRRKSNATSTNNQMYKDMVNNDLTIDDFTIEIIQSFENIIDASRLESKLIRNYSNKDMLYNRMLGASGRRVFSDEDIIFIRNLYQEKKLSIDEAYDKYYKDIVTHRAFKKTWHGNTFKDIAYHVYTKENKAWHFAKGQSRPGSKNGRSVFNEEDVIKIRKMKNEGKIKEEVKSLYEDKNKIVPNAFNSIWLGNTWKHLL